VITGTVHSSAKQIWWSDVGLNPYTKYMTIMSHFLEFVQIEASREFSAGVS